MRTRWPRRRSSSARVAPTPESSARTSQDESLGASSRRGRALRRSTSHTTEFRSSPLSMSIGRHARGGAQRLHDEAVDDGERIPATVADRDVAFDLLRLVADTTRTRTVMCCFGRTVDRAVPDPGRQVRVFVLLLSEKWCAEERLEGAVDERRMESVVAEFVGDRVLERRSRRPPSPHRRSRVGRTGTRRRSRIRWPGCGRRSRHRRSR